MKFKYLIFISAMMLSLGARAQNLFWNFDDNQNPITIPPECDYRFDEVRGGVFMPTVDEMYEYGLQFLSNNALSVQQQGAYCLLGAALQDHASAQYVLAQLYEEGKILPQDDLTAYKWGFIAALNGQKEAESFTLMIEQFLTTDELEKTSPAIQETRLRIQENLKKKMEEERQMLEDSQKSPVVKNEVPIQSQEVDESDVPMPVDSLSELFTESDRM